MSPNEACGLILQSGNKVFIYPCKNISLKPEKYFELSPLDYIRAYNNGNNKIIGIFHSQESITPSMYDYVIASGHNLYSVVYSWKNNTFFEINDEVSKYIKYVGREFQIGKNDCFSLVRDFYKQEYNIIIKDYFRDDKWFERDPNIIRDNYKMEGFIEIDQNELKTGNVIIFSYGHFGIYIEHDKFLHHPRNKVSTIDKLTDIWIRKIDICVKYNGK